MLKTKNVEKLNVLNVDKLINSVENTVENLLKRLIKS